MVGLIKEMLQEMKVIEKGIVVHFSCSGCGCKFVAGINIVEKSNDGNYYANCPMCGSSCHATVNDVKK
jgi:transcription elongation factor Elf1